MGRGRGSSASSSSAGLLGQRGSGSNGPGGREARASGDRGPGTPEDGSFTRKEKIDPVGINAEGTIVGTLPFDGEAPTGEALLEIKRIVTQNQNDARKVDRETIPVEYRDLVRRFHESLLKAGQEKESQREK